MQVKLNRDFATTYKTTGEAGYSLSGLPSHLLKNSSEAMEVQVQTLVCPDCSCVSIPTTRLANLLRGPMARLCGLVLRHSRTEECAV